MVACSHRFRSERTVSKGRHSFTRPTFLEPELLSTKGSPPSILNQNVR